MLTSFFSKSKPVIFLVVTVFMAIFFLIANAEAVFSSWSLKTISTKIGVLICFLLSVWVLDFIAKKNDLTKRSAFKIVIFAVFSVSFFAILRDNQVIIANLFILLSLRRVISLKSHKDIQKKIFDATFWVCIASLFYFWGILFIIVIYSGILLHTGGYFKNWLIPPIAGLCVILLVSAFHVIVHGQLYIFEAWFQVSSFDFANYRNLGLLIPLSMILALTFWTLFYYLGLIQKASINARPTYTLVLLTLGVSLAVAVLSPVKTGSELIFFFVPLAIIISNYFENKKDRTFKEILLIALLIMPVLIPLLF